MNTEKRVLKPLSIIMLIIGRPGFSACEIDDNINNERENKIENIPDITGYPIVGTNQSTAFNNSIEIPKPGAGNDFYGQNDNYPGLQ